MERAALDFSQTANGWKMTAKQSGKKIADCAVEKVAGADGKSSVMVHNSQYWVAPDITVCEGGKSRVRLSVGCGILTDCPPNTPLSVGRENNRRWMKPDY